MLFIPPNECGPDSSDRPGQLEYWCEVAGWLTRLYGREYWAGDVRTRLAVYHCVALMGEAANHVPEDIRTPMLDADLSDLARQRNILVHRPWLADAALVWITASVLAPLLIQQVRGIRQQPGAQ